VRCIPARDGLEDVPFPPPRDARSSASARSRDASLEACDGFSASGSGRRRAARPCPATARRGRHADGSSAPAGRPAARRALDVRRPPPRYATGPRRRAAASPTEVAGAAACSLARSSGSASARPRRLRSCATRNATEQSTSLSGARASAVRSRLVRDGAPYRVADYPTPSGGGSRGEHVFRRASSTAARLGRRARDRAVGSPSALPSRTAPGALATRLFPAARTSTRDASPRVDAVRPAPHPVARRQHVAGVDGLQHAAKAASISGR